MQYYPIFDRSNCEFVGIYKRTRQFICKRIKIPCLLAYTFKEHGRHASLMNEISNSVEEDRLPTLTAEDQEFIDHYNSFYIELGSTAVENFEIGVVDLRYYSQTNREHIKEILYFKTP